MNNATPPQGYYNAVFLPLLSLGQHYEKLAQQQLLKYYDFKYTIKQENNDNKYDFLLTNNETYEIKADLSAIKTNNIFIEFIQFGIPSGISTTTSDFHIFVIPYPKNMLFLMIVSDEIRELIKQCKYKSIYKDQYKAGYLFSIDTIKERSTLI